MRSDPQPATPTETLRLDLTDLRRAIGEHLTRRGYAASALHVEAVEFTTDADGHVTSAQVTVLTKGKP